METNYNVYYTLKKGSFPNETEYGEKFESYEDAFAALVNKYNKSGEMWGIYVTHESYYNGVVHSMTQPTWN